MEAGTSWIAPFKYNLCCPLRITYKQLTFKEANALFLSRPKLTSKAATSYGVLCELPSPEWLLTIKFLPPVAFMMFTIFVIAITLVDSSKMGS